VHALARLRCPPGLTVRTWNEGLSVVFCPSTGMTVLVTDDAGSLLQRAAASADGLADDESMAPDLVDGLLRSGLLARHG
jgi:hypothetical protein